MNNNRGGFISNILIVPIGIALMIGIFLLGYYVGATRSKATAAGQPLPPLPDMVSQQIPKTEEFTFYKTLTEKENKTVSIDVKPKPVEVVPQAAPQEVVAEVHPKPEQKADTNAELKPPTPPAIPAVLKPVPVAGGKLRYTIQIASYPNKGLAEEEVRNKKKQGYAAFVSAFKKGKSVWYRVRLGRFPDRDAAEKLLKELKSKEGGSPIITIE